MQSRGELRVLGQLRHELRHLGPLPGGLEVAPDRVDLILPEVAADERQGVDELHQPVREHDEERGRMLEPVAQFLEKPGFVKIDAHAPVVFLRLRVQGLEVFGVLLAESVLRTADPA